MRICCPESALSCSCVSRYCRLPHATGHVRYEKQPPCGPAAPAAWAGGTVALSLQHSAYKLATTCQLEKAVKPTRRPFPLPRFGAGEGGDRRAATVVG